MHHLNKDNFAEEIQTGLVFVKFATKTGCRPCAEFKEKYEKAEDDNAKFCTYERETLPKGENDLDEVEKKYQISSFPTILVFQDGELKGTMPKYKFYSNRDLAGMILDEQKKLYNQQCFVEDLSIELESRKIQPWTSKEKIDDFVLPNVPPAPHEEWCTEWCQ